MTGSSTSAGKTLALTVIAATASLAMQERPKPPTFATQTEIVLVDVVVRDKTGHAVEGLSASDFVVKEDGKDRPILTFTAFNGSAAHTGAAPSAAPALRPIEPRKTSTVVLVDDGHLSPAQVAAVRPALKSLLAKLGGGSGAMSIVAPLSKISVAGTLPAAAADLAAAADRINGFRFADHSSFPVLDSEAFAAVGGDPRTVSRLVARFVALNPDLSADAAAGLVQTRSAEIAFDARMRREIFYGIAGLALDWLAGFEGRHSLVVVSGGFVREPNDLKYNELVTRSLRVNAPLHFVDVRGLEGMGLQGVAIGPALGQKADHAPLAFAEAAAGSAALAEDTGGVVIHNTNDIGKGLERVLESMRMYYVIGYEPPQSGKPGFRRIKVDVKPRALRVDARRGYFVAAPAAR